jgi:hypothetical protein
MTVKAYFDGKVIIPDEPLDFSPNQALIVETKPVDAMGEMVTEPASSWIAEHAVERGTLPADLAERHDQYVYGCPAKGQGWWRPTSPILLSGLRFHAVEISSIDAPSHGTKR